MYRRVAARRLTEKAIHSGTAVNASEKLWTVSANNATEPDIATMTSCAAAVMPSTTRLILTARIPAALSRKGVVDAVGVVVAVTTVAEPRKMT